MSDWTAGAAISYPAGGPVLAVWGGFATSDEADQWFSAQPNDRLRAMAAALVATIPGYEHSTYDPALFDFGSVMIAPHP